MHSLKELIKNGEYSTDKNTTHSYIESYDKLFEPYKDKKINLLEIGNHNGGSLRLWNDYFSDATMVGLEIEEREPLKHFDDISNVTVHQNTSATSFETIRMIEDLGVEFDIIIDDGSHHPNDQIFTCKFWSKFLKDGGVMVIEDVQNIEFCKPITHNLPDGLSYEVIDLRENKGRFDDILIAVKFEILK